MKNLFSVMLFLLLLFSTSFAQKSRTSAMGFLSYSIIDLDNNINMFDVAGNPAWLVEDGKITKLELSPSYSNSSYDFTRLYSPDATTNYNLSAAGIKPLGSAGTFKGTASYNYLTKRNNNRTIELDPYSGKGFFYADTTKGDVTYKGPSLELMHSIKLFNNLYLGASVKYKVWDGLKDVSSYAMTTFRDVDINFGSAYSLSDNLTLGANFIYNNSQENIEVSDPNNLSITTDSYFGELHSARLIVGSKNEKIRNNTTELRYQVQWNPAANLDILVNGSVKNSNSALLSSSSSTYKDREDAFADISGISNGLLAQYRINDEFTTGLKAEYHQAESWTKISEKNLKIWDWQTDLATVGAGISYCSIESGLLIGIEYEISDFSADSSKYIDNKYNSISSLDHLIKIGAEYQLSPYIISRAGYNFQKLEEDMIFGTKNVSINRFTCGLGVKLSELFTLDFTADYLLMNPEENKSNLQNRIFMGSITIRTYSF